MLLLGNGVCSGGIATYFSKIGYGIWGTFGVSTSIFFLLCLGLHEFFMRRYNRRNFKLIEGDKLTELIEKDELPSYTPTQIEHAVEQGDSLVICDNLVLRVGGYERIHPGGKFTIAKNFGRDIAKFYYGNYALTNGKITKPHTHTGQANAILESMIIGVIQDQHDAKEVPTKIFAKHELTDNIATFTFKHLHGKPVRNYKGWYYDLGMVAKHFTVSSRAMPHIKRQYTICQTMEMHVLKALFKLAKDIIDSGPGTQIRLDNCALDPNFEKLLFPSKSKKESGKELEQEKPAMISLTMKNYQRPNGVATQINNVDLTGLVNFAGSYIFDR